MRLIYHDETKPMTNEQVYQGCRQGYGIKQPDKISGFMGFCYRIPDIFAYGMLETWLVQNEKLEEELKSFINRFKAEDYGFVTRDEYDENVEDRWLCGSCKRNIGRYSFSKDYNHYGGVVLEFFDNFGLMYSIEEDMSVIYGKNRKRFGLKGDGDMNEETHKKKIGYLAPQYREIWIKGCSGEPDALTPLFDEAKETAQEINQPCWPVKNAAIFYTFEGKCYETGPWRMDCTEEVFEIMSNTLMDHMYELGAYDMFYSGMLD